MTTQSMRDATAKPHAPHLLAARFTPQPEALAAMRVATLKMPYGLALWKFSEWLEEYFEHNDVRDDYGKVVSPKPPYRLLNNALISCATTIAHAFEWYSGKDRNGNDDKGFRMLVIAKSDDSLLYPDVKEIANVMRQWVRVWGERPWLARIVAEAGEDQWRCLLDELDAEPDTDWRIDYNLLDIFTNPGSEGGLAFELIPSLLATLLHETESVIDGKTIHWRRMQEGGKHLSLISQPLPVHISRTSTRRNADGTFTSVTVPHDAFLCYKVEILLHSQAGLATPWVYLKPHCTRLAHLPMTSNKRHTELTILTGTNEVRLAGWARDTTLVRLHASSNPKHAIWVEDLPNLLERIGARPLQSPKDILANPQAFWHADVDGRHQDQYFPVHTEGYSYQGAKTHPVMAGLPLPEQAEIIGALWGGLLQDVLIPDPAMPPDAFHFKKNEEPDVLRNIDEIRKCHGVMTVAQCRRAGVTLEQARQKQRDEWRPTLIQAVTRATRGKRLIIGCFYHDVRTLEWIKRGLWRNSLLLDEADILPENIEFVAFPIPVNQMDLIKPCPRDSYNNAKKSVEVRGWRESLLLRWQKYIVDTLGTYQADSTVMCSAIVELDASHNTERSKFPERESARSVIREAFARQNIRVQMTLPMTKAMTGYPQYDAELTGKSLNVVQEVVTRQIGAVFAPPVELYHRIGLDQFGEAISENLDVIAFSFRSSHSGIRYCVATRLRADGTVDVMLPGEKNAGCWIPYTKAYTQIGTIFSEARKYTPRGKLVDFRPASTVRCPLRLNPIDAAGFVEDVLTKYLDSPTVAIIEADNWRQSNDGRGGWWQLANSPLVNNRDALLFPSRQRRGTNTYKRSEISQLLAVIRLRSGDETPGYVTNRTDWKFDGSSPMLNYSGLTGFVDDRPTIFHYLSVNGVGHTNSKQPQHRGGDKPAPYKIAGSQHAYKHSPLIEMVPFFVRDNFDHFEGLKALCRVPHYLRLHPGWGMGNVNSPYLIHLGDTLIADQECILGLGD